MALHPLAERILEDEVCMAEVHEHCANRLMAWVKATHLHHTADTCTSKKKKDCCHAPGQGEVELAADHVRVMPQVCTCGRHT